MIVPALAKAPGAVNGLAALVLLTGEFAPAGFAADVAARPDPSLPAETAEVSHSQRTAPSSGDSPAGDRVWTGAWPLDTSPLDLSGVQRGLDEFFTHLGDLEVRGCVGGTLPFVPAIIVATVLAYECRRCWRMQRVAVGYPAEDVLADLTEEG
jgi:hypothetical protein